LAATQRPQIAGPGRCGRRRRGPLSLRGRCASRYGRRKLVWGMPAETDILDPHATGGWLTYDVTYQIFEALRRRT